jgi:hypothetical protein
MIFPEHRTLFFHIPRTGGTSVERMLAGGPLNAAKVDHERLWGWEPTEHFNLHHATIETTLQRIGEARFAEYYKFAICRDPFDRMVSVYAYNHRHYHEKHGAFKNYVLSLPRIVNAAHCRKGHHETPQHHFTHRAGRQAVDTLLRFEALPDCMDEVRTRLGITAPLPRTNESPRPELSRVPTALHYDDEMIAVMQHVYASDFELLGYPSTPRAPA